MTSSASGLRALRAIYRNRETARTAADMAYFVYATLLVLLMVGFPVTRTLVILLSPPEVIALLQAPAAGQVVGVVFGAILIVIAALGAVRGPVLLSPFFVTLLADTASPRSRTLGRNFASASIYFLLAMLFLGVVVSVVRVFGGGLPLVSGIAFVVACLLFSVTGSVLWLFAQVLSRNAWVLVLGLAFAVSLTILIPPLLTFSPWGWLGIVWMKESFGLVLTLGALTVLAISALLLLPRSLNSLGGEALLEQAQRWQAATIAAATGDMAVALGRFRPPPRIGRRWEAVGRGGLLRYPLAQFFRSDAVGALRTPLRLFGGLLTLAVASALVGISLTPGPLAGWPLGAISATFGYLGCGVLVDGFRYCAVSSGAPPLYPYSPLKLYALHLPFPLLATVASAVVGSWISVLLGAAAYTVFVALLIALLVVLARAFDSAKGPPPLILLGSPVPNPAGDPTVLFLFAWQADAPLIVAASAGVIVWLVGGGLLLAAAALCAVIATGLILLLHSRIRAS